MKALGIVRKLDDLGRLTIPMEVRRTNNWPDNAAMEMFMSEGGLVIREYKRPAKEYHEVLENLKGALAGGQVTNETLLKAIELIETKK